MKVLRRLLYSYRFLRAPGHILVGCRHGRLQASWKTVGHVVFGYGLYTSHIRWAWGPTRKADPEAWREAERKNRC